MVKLRTSLEIIAPTVEEAIQRGMAELGTDRESLEVEVLDEGSKGLFGLGSRQARVRLTLRQAEAHPTQEQALAPEARLEDLDEPEVHRLTRDTVMELLQRMGYRAKVDTRWGEPADPEETRYLLVDIRGENLGALIGRRSETLSALQYITRLIVGKELHRPVPIVIDIGGYRARREGQLRRMARKIAQQAIEQNRTIVLEPMPPHERRIIHLELRNSEEVYTESIGEGDRRKVTIIPRKN